MLNVWYIHCLREVDRDAVQDKRSIQWERKEPEKGEERLAARSGGCDRRFVIANAKVVNLGGKLVQRIESSCLDIITGAIIRSDVCPVSEPKVLASGSRETPR